MAEEQNDNEEIKDDEELPVEDVLGMSDEEFLEKGGEGTYDMPIPSDDDPDTSDDETDTEDQDQSTDDEKSEGDADSEEQPGQEEDTPTEGDATDDEADPDLDTDSEKDGESDTDGDTQETDEVDFKAEYRRIVSPFRANGKEIKVDNVDDAIQLMQMGAGFAKKMQILKPRLKIIKMLENNDLLDPEKINELIDLNKKNPQAIAKLLKDAEIDPLDVNVKNADDYTPTDHRVSDTEINLDQVIDDLKGSDTYAKTMAVAGDTWDADSRKIIAKNPTVLTTLDEHMQNGIYDIVSEVVERNKILGKVPVDMPDIEAYRITAEALAEEGAFKRLADKDTPGDSPAGDPDPAPKKGKKKSSKDKRRAAAPTKKTNKKIHEPEPDFLAMPDEEFMKKYA